MPILKMKLFQKWSQTQTLLMEWGLCLVWSKVCPLWLK